jgi:hypothetical protein
MSAPEFDWPGYDREAAVAEYKTTLTEDGEPFPMLKKLKIFRAIIVNLGIFAIGGYAMYLGGDPTLLGITVLLVAGAYNGLEYSDYTALLQAVKEVQAETRTDDGQD